ncbi:MATE family efflux transporter, partial [Achromobacter xylosoxidans]|uniref:MATE family efflux transporter n=1 Tax=Alcaligenes xylosoxydans xylosoxydans TaxID=85698 RepID=UPI0037628A6E
ANLYSAIAFFALGLGSATAPMAAHAEGARRNSVREVRRTVRQGFWSAVLISVPGCLALWFGEHILLQLRQPPELAAPAGQYLRALLWAMPPLLGLHVLRSFVAALQQPRWAFIVAVGAILLNVLGNWLLVFANLGAPAIGLNV